jgi:hypothetical protein
MIGKRERNDTISRKPALHTTEEQSILYRVSGRGTRENYWLISIGARKSLQPSALMKYRGLWVSSNQVIPATVRERIYSVDGNGRHKSIDPLAC